MGQTRAGAFIREADGTLHDGRGRVVLGLHGALRLPPGATVDARALGLPATSRVQSGFLEGPAVDAISQMIDVLSAERALLRARKRPSPQSTPRVRSRPIRLA